jgi:hypothetical protein
VTTKDGGAAESPSTTGSAKDQELSCSALKAGASACPPPLVRTYGQGQPSRTRVGSRRYYRTNGWHALALAYDAADQPDEAERYFKLALDGLTEDRQWREAAQVARQWARLLRRLDRGDEAFKLMEQATVLATRAIGREAIHARDAR